MNVLIVRTVVSIWKIIEMNRINTVVTMIFVTWLCIWGPLCKQWNITLLTLKLFATANRLGAQILTTAPQVVWRLWSQALGQAMGLISSWACTHLLEWGRKLLICMVSLNFRVPYIYPGKNIIFKITESNHFPYYFEFEMLEIPSKCFAVALNSSTYINLSTKLWT